MAKISDTPEEIVSHALSILIPDEILQSFKLRKVIENDSELLFDLEEKETCIPIYLKGKDVVLNGYLNSTTLQSFPLKGKHCYIHLRRRRWKLKSSSDAESKSYHNEYEYTSSGTMATKAFGAFLKRNSLITIPSRLAQSL
jgi:hypothetical protein